MEPEVNLLLPLIFNYRASATLFAASQAGFFNLLDKGPATATEIAQQIGSQPYPTELLLNACAAIGLLEKEGNLYRNSPLADTYLVAGRPNSLDDHCKLQRYNYATWANMPKAMYNPRPVAPEVYLDDPVQKKEIGIGAFRDAAMIIGGAKLPEYIDLTGCKHLLTIGGPMPASLTIKVIERTPGLRATVLFDEPRSVDDTKELVAHYGLSDRIAIKLGDLYETDWGSDNDAVMLVVLQQRSPENCQRLIKKSYDALVKGGQIYIAGYYITDPDKTSPTRSALWSLNMLVKMPEGEAYSSDEINGWLKQVGFVDPVLKDQAYPLLFRGIIAKKP